MLRNGACRERRGPPRRRLGRLSLGSLLPLAGEGGDEDRGGEAEQGEAAEAGGERGGGDGGEERGRAFADGGELVGGEEEGAAAAYLDQQLLAPFARRLLLEEAGSSRQRDAGDEPLVGLALGQGQPAGKAGQAVRSRHLRLPGVRAAWRCPSRLGS